MKKTEAENKQILVEISIVLAKAEVALRTRLVEKDAAKIYRIDAELERIFVELAGLSIKLGQVVRIIKRDSQKLKLV